MKRLTDDTRTLNILLVEPDRFESQMLTRFLQTKGHEVREAPTGEEAILKMLSERPETVIAEDRLPDGTALALTRWMKGTARYAAVPLLVLTSQYSGSEDAVRAYDAGAEMVVKKPIDLDLLNRKLCSLADRLLAPADAGRRRDVRSTTLA